MSFIQTEFNSWLSRTNGGKRVFLFLKIKAFRFKIAYFLAILKSAVNLYQEQFVLESYISRKDQAYC